MIKTSVVPVLIGLQSITQCNLVDFDQVEIHKFLFVSTLQNHTRTPFRPGVARSDNRSVAGQRQFRCKSRKNGQPGTEIGHRRQKASQGSKKMKTRDATPSHLPRKTPLPATHTTSTQTKISGCQVACGFGGRGARGGAP